MCKVINTVQSLVWLRRAVRRWRSRLAASVRPDKDKNSTTMDATETVPAGHVAVRVEGIRFAVRLAHLSHPAFRELLRQAEEEYGFASTSGPLVLPCDVGCLRDVLRRVSQSSGSEERRRPGDARPLLQGLAMEKLVS
jgi:SAUR family protein